MITDINQLDMNKRYTYADYLTWDFDEMVELIKGKIFKMSPAPLRVHQRIAKNISFEIEKYLTGKKCQAYDAPFDVRLVKKKKSTNSEITTIVQPDISVICDLEKLDDYGCIGAPDLIVEVLSKSTKKKDYHEKYQLYEENGVLEYWIADPVRKEIDVFVLENGEYANIGIYDKSGDKIPCAVFPDFELVWDDVFRDM